jgi:hypothetical protein
MVEEYGYDNIRAETFMSGPLLDYQAPTPKRSAVDRIVVLIFFAFVGGIAACVFLILAYWYTGAGLQIVD